MTENEPLLSRRLLLAAFLAAIVAGGATALASFGTISAPGTEAFRFSRGTALAAGEEARLKGFSRPPCRMTGFVWSSSAIREWREKVRPTSS